MDNLINNFKTGDCFVWKQCICHPNDECIGMILEIVSEVSCMYIEIFTCSVHKSYSKQDLSPRWGLTTNVRKIR